MSLLNKKFRSAVEILIAISLDSRAEPLSSKDISEKLEIGLRYTEGLVSSLVKAGYLRSVRGARGGYLLAKDRRMIKLGDLFKVNFDAEKKSNLNDSKGLKVLQELDKSCATVLHKELQKKTLEDLVADYKKEVSLHKKSKNADFVI